MSEETLRQQLLDYMAAHNVAVLAFADANGPWATPVFYAADGFTLYFVSEPATRHGAAIGDGARLAAAITEDHREWTAIQGLQLEGFCRPVGESERPRAEAAYLAKFPFAAAFLDPAGPLYATAGAKVRFYALVAEHLAFTDNQTGFGHRQRYSPQS